MFQEEKILSESFSSLLNKAYSTLVNPLQRGLYMLKICGLNIEEGSITMDSSFLGEIMEWNEQVEEANTKESIENLKNYIDIILVNLYKLSILNYFVLWIIINICYLGNCQKLSEIII